jgi:hypothetical protein
MEFWVGIRGNPTAEQLAALESTGIAVDDLRLISGGFGTPVQWETLRTCVRIPAADESEAKATVAQALDSDADLVAYSAEIFR